MSVDGSCNHNSTSKSTTSYAANSCTLIPWGKQIGGRPAAGWYMAPCGEHVDDDEDDGDGSGKEKGGKKNANAASYVAPSVATILLLWAAFAVMDALHLA